MAWETCQKCDQMLGLEFVIRLWAEVVRERNRMETKDLISFEQAMEKLSRDDRFNATVYAMNGLLVQKGIYSPEEFEFQFRQFAQNKAK